MYVLVTTPIESSLGYKPTVRNAHSFDLIWKKGYLEQHQLFYPCVNTWYHDTNIYLYDMIKWMISADLEKKWGQKGSTVQRFICTEVASYKIHTLVIQFYYMKNQNSQL